MKIALATAVSVALIGAAYAWFLLEERRMDSEFIPTDTRAMRGGPGTWAP